MNALKLLVYVGLVSFATTTWTTTGVAKPHAPHAERYYSTGRTIPPVVSSTWLKENANRSNLVILDVRPEAAFLNGHITNSLSVPFQVPFSEWITMTDDLLLELPSQAELFQTIGSLGITPNSWVVVVSAPNAGEPASYGFSAATRVADTLIYAGLDNVSVLDGGYPQWLANAGVATTTIRTPSTVTYNGQIRANMFVSTEYVKAHLGRATLLDARDADVYFGTTIEPFANKAGHIPTAHSLPTPWLWSTDGIYKDRKLLSQMVSGVVGWNPRQEIIVYCGVGGYASSLWFVLTQVLGIPNVKFYDGAAQSWAKSENMVPFRWE